MKIGSFYTAEERDGLYRPLKPSPGGKVARPQAETDEVA